MKNKAQHSLPATSIKGSVPVPAPLHNYTQPHPTEKTLSPPSLPKSKGMASHRKLRGRAVPSGFCTECDEFTHCSPKCQTLCHMTCDDVMFQPPPPPQHPLITSHENYQPPPPPSPHIPLSQKLYLAILIICVSLLLSYTIYRLYKKWSTNRSQQNQTRHNNFHDENHGPVDHFIWHIRTPGINKSVIDGLTICKYKKSEGLVEGNECSVCLSEFQEDETLRLLPECNHAFHAPCIDTWLGSNTSCPVCRAGIVTNPSGRHVSEITFESLARRSAENRSSVGTEEEVEMSSRDVIHPVRRSVSFDSSVVANNHSDENSMQSDEHQGLLKSVGSSSIGRSGQKEPNFMKRSFSSGGNFSLSGNSRSRARSQSQDVVGV